MTTADIEATLSELAQLRANLLDQWIEFMFLDDSPAVVDMRAAIVRDDRWAAERQAVIRRMLERQRATESMDAGLAGLVERYQPPRN